MPPPLSRKEQIMIFRKSVLSLLAGAVAVLTAVGCSGEKHIISYESGNDNAVTDTSPSIPSEEITAVILLPNDPDEGAAMSAAHAEAFTSAAQDAGVASYKIIPAADPEKLDDAAKDANVIFGADFSYMNLLDGEATENPDKLYACFGGYKYNSTNYSNYSAAIYEAQYLAGIVAGTNTESSKLGVISEYTTEYPDSAAEINSFALGARAANPNAEISVYSLFSRTDMTRATEYTDALISEGCDIISVQCDFSVPAAVAGEVGVIGYGSSSDTNELASVVWELEDYYASALSSAADGTWCKENYYGSLKDGTVALSVLSDELLSVTEARLAGAAELITGDRLDIFSNLRTVFDSQGTASTETRALTDNRSNTMISEDGSSYFIYSGDKLTPLDAASVNSDKLASASMNYLVEGITVK